MPQRIEDTLLIVAPFKRDGVEYQVGDRVPVRHRAIRRIAAERPEFFAMEYASEDLDLEWLAGLEADAEARYQAVKRIRDGEAERRERALRQELEDQVGQPDLERRFKEQERKRKQREQELREERDRERLEEQVPFTMGGFNY